jgi:hypothetical protein
MAQNFKSCDRDQALLMPPSLRDWLAPEELAWCVLDAVAEMDLAAIYGSRRVKPQPGTSYSVSVPSLRIARYSL